MSGPVPKPATQKRDARPQRIADITHGHAGPRKRPPTCPASWHDMAKQWFNSLKTSGQSEYYEASDWAYAMIIGEAMSRWLNGTSDDKMPAQLFSAIMQGMTELLTTEGARRRARLELTREAPQAPASISIMEGYRAKGLARNSVAIHSLGTDKT